MSIHYIPQWQPPDPPEDLPSNSVVICPYCGSNQTGIARKGSLIGVLYTKYECYFCDQDWHVFADTVDDDDIPF